MIKKILVGLFIAIGFTSCKKDDSIQKKVIQAVCDESGTSFAQLYNNLSIDPYAEDEVTLDNVTHTYNFEVSENKTICKIGYQSIEEVESEPFLIEIYNNTTDSILYSGNHVFSSSETSYVSIDLVQVEVGNSYTIRRTADPVVVVDGVSNLLGRIIWKRNDPSGAEFQFPIISSELTITGSSSYDDIDFITNYNFAIPYIDIVFEN